MRLDRAAAIMLVILAAGLAQAQEPAAAVAAKAEFRRECVAAGYTGAFKAGFLKTADFNGDGKPDYILDSAKMECGSYYCGTAGCVIVILMSGPQGHSEGFRDNVREWSVRRTGQRDILHAGLHGSECRRAGNHTCNVTFTWRVDGFVKSR